MSIAARPRWTVYKNTRAYINRYLRRYSVRSGSSTHRYTAGQYTSGTDTSIRVVLPIVMYVRKLGHYAADSDVNARSVLPRSVFLERVNK